MLCTYCKKEFKPKSTCKQCSLECRIRYNIIIENDCWIWKKKITNCGYGEITVNCKYLLVHRKSYELFKGEIPKGMNVCHSCDSKLCCNPDHLWIGSQKENIQDCIKKGRFGTTKGYKHTVETKEKWKTRKHADRKGEKHHLRKLSNEQILEIRKDINKQSVIAKKYGVGQSVISRIKRNEAWSHVT